MKIHPVFHANLLKPYIPCKMQMPPQPPLPELIDGHLEWEVYRILSHRDVRYQPGSHGRRSSQHSTKREYLIHWAGFPIEEATWEPASHLKNSKEFIDVYFAEKQANESRLRCRQRL